MHDARHATYLSAADGIEQANEFADHLHLARSGANDFSARLAVKICELDLNETDLK
jgi:hypothetical protein